MSKVLLSSFDPTIGFDRGRPKWIEVIWYLCKCAFLLSALPVAIWAQGADASRVWGSSRQWDCDQASGERSFSMEAGNWGSHMDR